MTEDEVIQTLFWVGVGVIVGMILIVGTAYFFGCHAAIGDLCSVVKP